jgi:hypothetical protein
MSRRKSRGTTLPLPGAGPLYSGGRGHDTRRMTVEPAPAPAGSTNRLDAPPSPASARPAAGVDDEARLRHTAQQQWVRLRHLERQLHDGAALRISALVLRLGMLRHRTPDDEQQFQAAVEAIQDELHLVLQELRDVAGMLYPPLLDEAGLGPALREAAARCPRSVRIDAGTQRFGPAAEGAAYFAVLGCLDAESREGRDDTIEVVVRGENGDGRTLVLLVVGVDPCHASTVHDGVRLLGGTAVTGETDSITVRIPCE